MNEFQKEVSLVKLSIIIYLTILLATFLFAVASLRVDGNTLKESLSIYYVMLWCVILYMGSIWGTLVFIEICGQMKIALAFYSE